MAVVALKSTSITQRDTVMRTQAPATLGPRKLYSEPATVEVTNGDSIGSTYRLLRLKSSDRVRRLDVFCDAITSAAADFGLYRTADDGGAVVDADFFASAQSIASAITTGTNITHESGVVDISEVEQPLWQLLGLSADPLVEYDLVATLTAAATATGTLTVVCDWTRAT